MSPTRVLVGMSGGVDSTAAVALLHEKGYEVAGITLNFRADASRCCNPEDVRDARYVCSELGIPHFVLDTGDLFQQGVVDYFVTDYLEGCTPNPCVVCNRQVKFSKLIDEMHRLGYDCVATGHYAQITRDANGTCILATAADPEKSQEYFLARLRADDLPYIIFPAGSMTKNEIREYVASRGLLREKKDSQEICFLHPGESPADFIERETATENLPKGHLRNAAGDKLKTLDRPYYRYTIGQRRGLNYSAGKPMYVTRIEPSGGDVYLGGRDATYTHSCVLRDVNLLVDHPSDHCRTTMKVRYRQEAAPAELILEDADTARVNFDEPQFAVTPGQLAVWYAGDTVCGSGFIVKDAC